MTCKNCGGSPSRRDFLEQSLRFGVGGAAMAMGVAGGPAAAAEVRDITVHCLCPTWCRAEDIAPFEAESAVKITRACWTSHLATLTKMATGGAKIWDVVQAHHAFVFPMIRRKLLMPLDMAKIPNAKFLFPQFAKLDQARAEGKTYGVPYVWTYDSVVYNVDHIDNVDSWGVLFDDKYKGKVALRDDAQNAIQLTALYLGHKDPSVLTSEDLAEIKKFLISKKANFRKFWTGYAEAMTLLKSGEVWALSGWRPMWWALAKDGMNIKYAVPKEKGIGAIGYYVISSESKQPAADYAFLNWMLGGEWGAAVGRDQGYQSTSSLVLKKLDPKLRAELGYNDIDAVLKDVFFLDYPLNLNEWISTWTEVKAA